MTDTIRIATRQSPLALWQAEFVQQALESLHPGIQVELVKMTTRGDQILDAPLAKIGGKGLFVKELERSMMDGESDLAVHSMKDVPMEFPEGLGLSIVCERECPFDAFVSNQYEHFDKLPQGAVVGTSSLRRQCQILKVRPDLQVKFLRGNVGTRLSKLDAGEYDAIILASAGLIRLELEQRIRHHLEQDLSMPACGQGAVGIECRTDDERLNKLLEPLMHGETWLRVSAERAMNKTLEGGCQVPIAGYAELKEGLLTMEGRVGSPDGQQLICITDQQALSGSFEQQTEQAEQLGQRIAEELLQNGADAILKSLYQED